MDEPKQFLVVDDDEIFLFTAKYALKKVHPEIEIVTKLSGQEGLNEISKQFPKALFLDLNMPGLDGWAVLDKLSSSYPAPPFRIIIVTSSIDASDRERAEKHAFKPQFVEKPLSKEKVEELQLND